MQPLPTFSCAFGFRCMFTPCEGIQILEYRKFFLVESRKFFIVQSGILSIGILSIGIQDTAQGIWNAPLTIGLQNPNSTNKDWNPVPGIWNPQYGIQNLRLSWITLQGVSMCTTFALHLPLKGKYFCQSYLKIFKVYNIIPKLHKNKVCSQVSREDYTTMTTTTDLMIKDVCVFYKSSNTTIAHKLKRGGTLLVLI